MTMRLTLTDATFTPGEAERITGVPNVQQRDWRRRGYLPQQEGHARFTAMDLSRLLALKMLADRGIGPARGQGIVAGVALRLCAFALQWRNAWELDEAKLPGESWGERRRHLDPVHTPEGAPFRFFLWTADDDSAFAASLDSFFDARMTDDPKVAGPVIVFDLEALGALLLSRAGRPLVRCDIQRAGE